MPRPVVQTEANENAGTLSPEGRWLVYASDISGRQVIYTQSFPNGGGKRQVSSGGGGGPHWRRDGQGFLINELVETNPDAPLTVAVGQTHRDSWRGEFGC